MLIEGKTFIKKQTLSAGCAAARSLAFITRGPSLRNEGCWTERSSSDKVRTVHL